MIRTKSFSSIVVPSDTDTETLFITGAVWAAIEMVAIDIAIKCDSDLIPLIYVPAGRTISTVIVIRSLGQ